MQIEEGGGGGGYACRGYAWTQIGLAASMGGLGGEQRAPNITRD